MRIEDEAVRDALSAAGEILTAAFSQAGRGLLGEKAKGHPVTKADCDADRAIRERITARFPRDGWLSEETADDSARLARERVWIVDPMDGTKDFLAGRPEFCVSIALVARSPHGYRPEAAWVYLPIPKVLYRALRAGGAFREEGGQASPLSVSDGRRTPPHLTVSRTETGKGLFAQWEAEYRLDPQGSIARKLCLVAAGEADGVVTLNPRSEWDIAAGVLIAAEAGARVTNHAGGEILFNQEIPRLSSNGAPTGLVAATPNVHARILARLARLAQAAHPAAGPVRA